MKEKTSNIINKGLTPLAILEGYETAFFQAELGASLALSERGEDNAPESRILQMYNDDTVGVIEVKGKLTNVDSPYNHWFGLVSYNQIRAAATEAVEMGASALLFDYDTPGGRVSGVKDCADFISSLDVPTVSHTSATMASAGVFLGISSDKVYMDDMSEIGSVGVVLTTVEYVEAMKKAGVKAHVFRSGKHKQAGNPYEKLSAENKKYIQEKIMFYADKFYDFVSEKRGIPVPSLGDITTGRTYVGEQGVAAGLADKIMSFDQALMEVVRLADKVIDKDKNNRQYYNMSSTDAVEGSNNNEEGNMAKKLFSPEVLAAMSGKTAAVESNVDDQNTGEGTEDQLDMNDQNTEAEGSENTGADGQNTGEGTEDQNTEAGDTDTGEGTEANDDAALVQLQEDYDASQVTIANLEETVATLTTEIETNKKSAETLAGTLEKTKKVLTLHIASMRTAMSLSKVDMREWTADMVLTEHATLTKSFEASFVPGGHVDTSEGNEGDDKAAAFDRNEMNAMKNLF